LIALQTHFDQHEVLTIHHRAVYCCRHCYCCSYCRETGARHHRWYVNRSLLTAYAEKNSNIDLSADILNYALTLEHLEDKFYREGLANFTQEQFAAAGYDATFYATLQRVSSDEMTHVNFLTTALKGKFSLEVLYEY